MEKKDEIQKFNEKNHIRAFYRFLNFFNHIIFCQFITSMLGLIDGAIYWSNGVEFTSLNCQS